MEQYKIVYPKLSIGVALKSSTLSIFRIVDASKFSAHIPRIKAFFMSDSVFEVKKKITGEDKEVPKRVF